ncbi:MAG: hypothetical protein QM726_09020 [Chitinophagaceae bacterium]
MNRKLKISFASVITAIFAFATTANGQYYYKDIVVTAQISANYLALKNNKVTNVAISPVTAGKPDAPITIEQTINPAQDLVVTYTKTPDDGGESWLKSYYNKKGLLILSTDSAEDVVTRSYYTYNADNRISSITSKSEPVNSASETEVHNWFYNSNGQPVKMVKIKDNTDTTNVSFIPDEQGNPGEERAIRKNGNVGTIYYYYDAQHRLTDVARYNKKADRILPDYMFEYNEGAQLSQMILVPEGSNDYQTWKYLYNASGLKEKEICYNKQKQMAGSVTYTYSFGR